MREAVGVSTEASGLSCYFLKNYIWVVSSVGRAAAF